MKLIRTLNQCLLSLATLLCVACGGGSDAAPTSTSTELAIVKPSAACAALTSIDLADVGGTGSTIATATEGDVAINGVNVKFCTVEGTLAPTVNFRVRLPVESWTQRYMHLGCGGLCGNVSAETTPGSTAYGCPLVQSGGFVLSSSDMGHSGNGSDWTTDAAKRADFAYRGVHVTTLAAKKLIRAYYGQAQKRSYFVGCSDGGREALMAAQRYPSDYEGIIAGAPAFHFQIQNTLHHAWLARSNRDTGLSTGTIVLKPSKAAVLHTAVVAACDALDGQTDGLLSDPRLCSFDPATIQCAADATDTSACLTAAEVTTATKFYNGPRDPSTNARILAGMPQYGSELAWSGVFVPASDAAPFLFSDIIVGGARNLIFTDTTPPTMDEFEFTTAFYGKLRARHPLNDATNPDLSAFKAAGGKLILWHGWADQHISPRYTIAYREAVAKTMGQSSMDAFMRTYLLPGTYHCGGGEGLPNVDFVTSMVNWVEKGSAPDVITSYKLDTTNNVTATRPIYPYPELAKFSGSGDAASASSYRRQAPLFTETTPDWAGADWFTPYEPSPL